MNPLFPAQFKVSRATWQLAQVSLLTSALAMLAGCSSEPVSHVVSAPPPGTPQTQLVVAQPQQATQVVVAQQPNSQMVVATQPNGQLVAVPTAQAPGTIIVMQAPPQLQQEVVLAQPSSDHKWVPGYWTWRDARYEWMAGHWELPPSSGATWIAPHSERLSNGTFRFYEGYWS